MHTSTSTRRPPTGRASLAACPWALASPQLRRWHGSGRPPCRLRRRARRWRRARRARWTASKSSASGRAVLAEPSGPRHRARPALANEMMMNKGTTPAVSLALLGACTRDGGKQLSAAAAPTRRPEPDISRGSPRRCGRVSSDTDGSRFKARRGSRICYRTACNSRVWSGVSIMQSDQTAASMRWPSLRPAEQYRTSSLLVSSGALIMTQAYGQVAVTTLRPN